jgi:hypothetical protein
MQRRITAFHQDPEQHWVADLECGHAQHIRHDPPMETRLWVLTEESRRSHLGTTLNCLLCDPPATADLAASSEARAAYEDARLRGLCADGASEVAHRRPKQP